MSDGSEKHPLSLRLYQAGDLKALHALDVECFEPPFRFSRSDLKRFLEAPNVCTLIAQASSEIAGFVIIHLLQHEHETFGYVVTLDVKGSRRRTGLGLRLMREAESLARAKGVAGMRLHVFPGNAGARQFYERLGYEELGRVEGFYGDDVDALLLGKPVQGSAREFLQPG